MLDLKIAYPEFVPNQILTDRQLNQLRTHLEQEDRLTRIRLAGMGIVCGLHGRRVDGSPRGVEIAAGYGVTSDGDLIELCPKALHTHFRPYADPDRDAENKLKYLPWRDPTDATRQLQIVELISQAAMDVPDEADRPAGATAFTAASLAETVAGRILVLYLERQAVDLNSCLVTSCDNKGRNINVHVRALLVKRTDLAALTGAAPPPAIHRVPRLHTQGFPQAAMSADQIRSAFGAVVTARAAALGASITALFDAYGPFLNLQGYTSDPLAGKLTGGLAQYRYGALLDIAAAYNEAAAAAYPLLTECCPNGTFPRHLMLGPVDGSQLNGFRHEFSPSPLRNVMHGEIDRVRDLFKRLDAMIFALDLDAHPAAVSVRPSHTAAYPLGRRARPFYFLGTGMNALWRPRPRGTMDGDWPWLHPAVAPDLATDYAESTLLRIEGHVGDPPSAAVNEIVARRHQGNAEFAILRSYVDDRASEERAARSSLAALLTVPQDDLKSAWHGFRQWLDNGNEDFNAIVGLAGFRRKQLDALDDLSKRWIQLRARRALHCDTAALQHDYLEARNDLLCLIGRARAIARRFAADVARLPETELIGAGLDTMRRAGRPMLADHLVKSVLASPEAWTTPDAIKQQLESLAVVDDLPAVREALARALANLDAELQRLQDAAQPRRVSELDFDLFAYFFRSVLADTRELWHWMLVLGVRIPGSTIELGQGGEARLDAAEDAASAADWLGLQGCLLARLASVSAAYELVREGDVSAFRNLARVDGLEHLAGVAKGGTFVLVCDTVAADGRVVADFSLDGALPCCCAVDAEELCLPPLALPDVRIVKLPDDERGELAVEIDVIANDCDLNTGGRQATMTIAAVTSESQHGTPLEVNPEGTIRYRVNKSMVPGTVDRFEYRLLLGGKCEGRSAIGTVIVLFTTDPIQPVTDGAIAGKVVHDDSGESGDDAIVTVLETGATLMTSGSGVFEIAAIAAGDYRLVAEQEGGALRSDPTNVRVIGGETVDVLLRLKKIVTGIGAVNVRVRDRLFGRPIPGAAVVLRSRTTGQVRTGVTAPEGMVRFDGVQPGAYDGQVNAPGFPTAAIAPFNFAGGLQEMVVNMTEIRL